MNLPNTENIPQTPAVIYDESIIIEKLNALSVVREKTGCKILYSIKAIPLRGLLRKIRKYVDGFSASSLFECRLAKEILKEVVEVQEKSISTVHLTSPGLREEDVIALNEYVDYISFNSVSQWKTYRSIINAKIEKGLRINPEQSFVKDERYDPCRKFSKLGVTLTDIDDDALEGMKGLHLHNNCESDNYDDLKQTVNHVIASMDDKMADIQWVNLGGGYLINNETQMRELEDIINALKQALDIDVFIEPGKGVVASAGYLISSVIDVIQSDGKNIAILDTTVNHLPEVFEYQYQPDLLEHSDNGEYEYRLAGSSCLSGDLFGDYKFQQALKIGSRVTFSNIGAYMFVKANTFNGINLPSIYISDAEGQLVLEKEFSYENYVEKY